VVKVVDFKSLALKDFWIFSCEEAIHIAYGTLVVLLRCPFVPEIMHGRSPEIFLYQ
jgi:hypothetical protein